jgi:rubrerythrin
MFQRFQPIPGHERLLSAVFDERTRLLSRRGLLTGGAKFGIGGALALTLAGSPKLGLSRVLAQDDEATAKAEDEAPFESDVDVLNYALTLEHLEYAFYRDGIGNFTFGADPFGNSIDGYLTAIRDHEGAHVETLTQVITDLGGEPVAEATYDFGYGTDSQMFLMTAAALENTGVSAYDGAAQYLENADLLTAAGGIVSVEARHAAYLNLITGELPFPDAFETAKPPAEILEIAGPFITG